MSVCLFDRQLIYLRRLSCLTMETYQKKNQNTIMMNAKAFRMSFNQIARSKGPNVLDMSFIRKFTEMGQRGMSTAAVLESVALAVQFKQVKLGDNPEGPLVIPVGNDLGAYNAYGNRFMAHGQ